MTKKTIVGENKEFVILRIDSQAAVCCGTVPFSSFCIRKKGSLQQLNLAEKDYISLQGLLSLSGIKPAGAEA